MHDEGKQRLPRKEMTFASESEISSNEKVVGEIFDCPSHVEWCLFNDIICNEK